MTTYGGFIPIDAELLQEEERTVAEILFDPCMKLVKDHDIWREWRGSPKHRHKALAKAFRMLLRYYIKREHT